MKPYSKARVIGLLEQLAERWPDEYMLFVDNGLLVLVEESSGMIVANVVGIPCDGGDPAHAIDDDGNEFIRLSDR